MEVGRSWYVYPQAQPSTEVFDQQQAGARLHHLDPIQFSVMGGGTGSGSASASEAASLVFRIATVGLSLASAIMTAASTQCVYRDDGAPAGTVSYADYPSFKYSAVADLVSAVLQGVAIYLEATRKEKAARAVELIDKVVQALTATSAALLFAVDDITSCGGPPRGGSQGRRQQRQGGGLCGQAGAFCGRVRVASTLSVAATVSVSASVYTRHVPVAAVLAPRPAPATTVTVNVVRRDDGRRRNKEEEEEEEEKRKVVVELIVPEEKMAEEVEMEEETKKEKEKKDQDQVIVVVQKDDEGDEEKKKDDECSWSTTLQTQDCSPPPVMPMPMPPPWCRCPRLTIPCDCEDPELCGAFF